MVVVVVALLCANTSRRKVRAAPKTGDNIAQLTRLAREERNKCSLQQPETPFRDLAKS